MSEVSIEELQRRVRCGEYIITPKKPTGQMNEHEALEWEKECLEARLRITEDPKRRPGLVMRIQDIQRTFLQERVKKAVQNVYDGPYENELNTKDAELDSEVGGEGEMAVVEAGEILYTDEPDDIQEPVEPEKPTKSVKKTSKEKKITEEQQLKTEDIIATIENDKLFD